MRSRFLLAALLSFGCGEPSVPHTAPRTVTLVQTVPSETTGFEVAAIPHTHDVWIDMIAGATKSVDVASFYVANRKPGRLEPVLVVLESAARRGIAVRLLVDASFSDKYPAELERLAATFAVRKLDLEARTGGVQHAKYMVVDGRALYIGSANFDWRSLEHIHELGLLIEAPEMAQALAGLFQLDWDMAGDKSVTPAASLAALKPRTWSAIEVGGQRLTLVASPKGLLPAPAAWDLPRLIDAIEKSRTSVAIQLLSYDAAHRDGSPWKELHVALLAAAARGVRVRLALSHWQQNNMEAIRELQRAPGIDVALVQVPEHSGGYLPFARVVHAKYMVIDGETSWIGTSNWKGDYFYTSRNVGVFVQGTGMAEQLGEVFEGVFGGPYAKVVDPAADYPTPRIGPE